MTARRVYPVILSGGAGSRLWPLSRARYPKQFLSLVGEQTMLQRTVLRVDSEDLFHRPLVIANDEHRFIVAEQLREIGAAARALVLEPVGRNTAPAAAVAALLLQRDDPDAVMALLPSDHLIADEPVFEAAVELACEAAARGHILAFGIVPDRAETGYGYIRRGGPLNGAVGCFAVERFVEKPDAATAETYLREGGWGWNSGVFVFHVGTFLDELGRHAPDTLAACREAVTKARSDLDFLRLDAEAFGRSASAAIDTAVMERTDRAAMIPVEMGWSDVGGWSALWEAEGPDVDGNVVRGDVVLDGVKGSYVRSEEGRLVVASGLDGMIVVATEDATLVAPRDASLRLKEIVAGLERDGRSEAGEHRRLYRPWGTSMEIDVGDRFKVKRLTVKPGASLSLQRHGRRAEHWVVVRGTARVTCGDGPPIDLKPDQSTYIPLGEVHRLENPGPEPLHVIEVQTGDYLGEDDIERLEDVYGRKAD